MSDYFGTPAATEDFLAHYGVKGMKWGVRKAREDRVSRISHPSPEYTNAIQKLRNIQDRKAEKEIAKVQKWAARGKIRKVNKAYKQASDRMTELRNNADRNYQQGQYDQARESQSTIFWWGDDKNYTARLLNRIDGHRSKKRLTDKGHAKAVKERDRYSQQMERMFRGTRYDKKRYPYLNRSMR